MSDEAAQVKAIARRILQNCLDNFSDEDITHVLTAMNWALVSLAQARGTQLLQVQQATEVLWDMGSETILN